MSNGGLLFVTDLDGCLLDPETYAHEAAGPALAELARERIPLVLCSGKTRAESSELVRDLGLSHPFIVENGVIRPRTGSSGPEQGRRGRTR